jgi:hypothetical protein
MKKVFITFIVKLIRIVCPTELLFIEIVVYVLDTKDIAFYRVGMETYFASLDHYSVSRCIGHVGSWKVYMTKQINLLNPTGYLMHQQFNSQQLYVLPTLYLCVLYLSENKQRLVPLTA